MEVSCCCMAQKQFPSENTALLDTDRKYRTSQQVQGTFVQFICYSNKLYKAISYIIYSFYPLYNLRYSSMLFYNLETRVEWFNNLIQSDGVVAHSTAAQETSTLSPTLA